jgi:hypothetical protein
MAASAAELRNIYANLFSDPNHPERLCELRSVLDKVDRRDGGSRADADRLLEALNDGADPRLTFTQLECLRTLLSARTFAPLVPSGPDTMGGASTSAHLFQLYRRLFSEPDLGHLRALQRAVFDYDQFGTDEKRLAVLALLREASPEGPWNDAHVGALDALLVRDITFKQVAPFQVSGDWW